MPAYVRRAVIADALGLVSSYRSNHENWEKRSPSDRGAEPVIGFPNRYELTFYEQERDISGLNDGVIGLKLYDGKTWNWYSFRISMYDGQVHQIHNTEENARRTEEKSGNASITRRL